VSDPFEIRATLRRYTVGFTEPVETHLLAARADGDVCIVDAEVARVHRGRLASLLDGAGSLILEANEHVKSYHGVAPVIEHLTRHGFRKDGRLVAIGGGVIQDVTAFTASILFRGVEWLCVPTTLLAQCDSCIGSKTSINFGAFKNQLGTFYPPSEVYIDVSLLRSLPREHLLSGLGEMAHYFLIAGEADFERFARDAPVALDDEGVLRGLIRRSLEIKRRYVEIDEFDRDARVVLNYGHSFGHALESLTEYRLPHGIAVSYGMDIANFVSAKLGLAPSGMRERVRAVLEPIWRAHPLGPVSVPRFVDALRRDKKNSRSALGLVLTRGIGDMFKASVEPVPPFTAWLEEYFR
jgi:3-dehydroquinate synthase